MGEKTIRPELEAEIASVAEGSGCELLSVEYAGSVLRIILDRPTGAVTLADCETVSRQLSPLLDVVDFGRRRYFLEVSSPGLDRPLYRPQDYERFRGRVVRVTFFETGPERRKKTIVGRLEDYRSDGGGRITVLESATGERYDIPLGDIKGARLEIEL